MTAHDGALLVLACVCHSADFGLVCDQLIEFCGCDDDGSICEFPYGVGA